MIDRPKPTFMEATISAARLRTPAGALVILLNGFPDSARPSERVNYKDPDGLKKAIDALPGAGQYGLVLAEHDEAKGWTVWEAAVLAPSGYPA